MFTLLATLVAAQATVGRADSVTPHQIREAYAELVRIEAVAPPGGDSMLTLDIVAPPDDHLLADFFRQHERWFTYLVLSGRDFHQLGLDDAAPGAGGTEGGSEAAALLQAELIPRLTADSQFNTLVVPAIAAHLRRTGIPVVASTEPAPRASLALDSAVHVAVRFFYPDLIVQGRIWTHVCTVLNAVRELPSRNLALEALIFSAIMGDIVRGDSSRLEGDFAPARRLMNALDVPGPDEIRLHRAQGVMWGAMAGSQRLREVLLAEARRQSDVLAFELR